MFGGEISELSVALFISAAVVIIIIVIREILKSPFAFPYFWHDFNVTAKRNVDIIDYIDRFLCDSANWNKIQAHQQHIQNWKKEQEKFLETCKLKNLRTKQYEEALDETHAFNFETIRKQTRYRQVNYVKSSYKVSMVDEGVAVDWVWLNHRYNKLKAINFEATLSEYESKSQRKLMTRALREEIMKRDSYTCQECGKHMPDEVGLHIDHIIPVAKGGKSVPSNLRVLCSKCNGRKGAK